MTKYHSRSEINGNTAKMDQDDRRRAAGRTVHDPAPAADFAAACLWTDETRAMPVGSASDLGVLALTLARALLEPIKREARADAAAAGEKLAAFLGALPVPDARELVRTVHDLQRLSKAFRLSVEARAGGRRLNGQYFGAALTAFQSGYDGHWITREAALRLRLVRYYEKTSGEFARCVHRAMAALAKNGTAYAAWGAGWPVFVCDLNNAFHRFAAQEILRAACGRLAVVSPEPGPQTRAVLARYAPEMAVIVDDDALLAALLGNYGTAVLLERRIGGWTVTFPAGGALERELKNKKYPAFARALARCAQTPAALQAGAAHALQKEPA